MMGIINDDGIYIGNIHATFNNIGTNQYIIFTVDEIEDAPFQFMAFHLPMSITDTKVRTKSLYDPGHFCQVLDPVVNKKGLTASFCLKINCLPDHILVKNLHLSLYGLTVWRRCIDD